MRTSLRPACIVFRSGIAACVLLACSSVAAQSPLAQRTFDIPQQNAADAVRRLVDETHFQILYSSRVLQDVVASPVHGYMTPREALIGLLRDAGIDVIDTGPAAATLRVAATMPDYFANNRGMPSVFVTARKFAELSIDVPIAVSVFPESSIVRRGGAGIATMLQDAPGVSIYDEGSGFNKVSIRGISTTLGGNENGFYLDDLPFSGVNVPLTPDIRAWDLERIEVLRGPQGTLFGEGSMGGTIRTLTNNAKLNTFSFAGQTGASHTQGGGNNRSVRAMVNVPLIADMLALRVAATDDDDSGWIDQPEAARENVNASRVKTWRARALFRPVDHLSINASYWRYASRYQSGNNATDAGTEPVSGASFASTPGYELKGISATWDLDAFTVFYGYSKNHYARPASGNQFELTIDIDVAAHELRWTSTARTPWRWTGGMYRRASVRRDDFVYPALGLNQRDTTSSTAESLFGEVTWTMPAFPLEASLGLRHFRDRLAGVTVSSGGTSQADYDVFTSNSPRLSLAYRHSDDLRVYASASKGFRSGQRQVRGYEQIAAANNVVLPAVIEPDTIWTYELGAKFSLPERRLAMEYAVYHSDWRDVAVRIPLGTSGANGVINSGGTTTNGIDASVSYAPTRYLRTTLGAAFVDARYAASVAGTGIRRGVAVDDVPRLTWNASTEFDFPLADRWSGLAQVGMQHASAHQAAAYPEDREGDAIDNVHARITFSKGPWKVSLYGENLANDRGAVSFRTVAPLDTTTTVTEAYSPRLRPRTIGLELGFAFD